LTSISPTKISPSCYFNNETRLRFIALIAALGELVDVPDEAPRILRDPKDDYLIACALAGNADFLVSGDKDVLELKAAGKIQVVSARQLLARWDSPL
jgi:putative PIN family toxin of toxin-antitoxin system